MKKAVIFDLDGTLADSLDSLAYCTNAMLKELQLPPLHRDNYRYYAGDGAVKLVERALVAAGDHELSHLQQAVDLYSRIFEKHCMYHVQPYPGMMDTLQELKQRGVFIAVLSNKPHERTLDVIHTLFGKDLFDVIAGQKPGVEKKPSPQGVFSILKELALLPEDALYVGDTNTDMKTGKAAGLFTLGALWGFRDRKELEENHADAVIERPQQILQYL